MYAREFRLCAHARMRIHGKRDSDESDRRNRICGGCLGDVLGFEEDGELSISDGGVGESNGEAKGGFRDGVVVGKESGLNFLFHVHPGTVGFWEDLERPLKRVGAMADERRLRRPSRREP